MKKLIYLMWGIALCPGWAYSSDHKAPLLSGLVTLYYLDADGDGFGDPANSIAVLNEDPPAGYVDNQDDCNDAEWGIRPGIGEYCNGFDDDCDGLIDDDDPDLFFPYPWLADSDGDGWGDPNTPFFTCSQPPGTVIFWLVDCDDANAAVYPGAPEIPCNGIDENCDGLIDNEQCNGIDDNCNGEIDEGVLTTFYADDDGDGFVDLNDAMNACSAPAGYYVFEGNADCDDQNAGAHPGAVEIPCNGIDEDCDGVTDQEFCNGLDDDCDGEVDEGVMTTWAIDYDGDSYQNCYIRIVSCTQPLGWMPFDGFGDDEMDTDPFTVGIGGCGCGGNEIPWYADNDGDGYGDPNSFIISCIPIAGYLPWPNYVDCDDTDSSNGLGNTFFEDLDGDGYGNPYATTYACNLPSGYSDNNFDCDDTNPEINVAPFWYPDFDQDGYGFIWFFGTQSCDSIAGWTRNHEDCSDDPFVNPAAQEICNGIDDDCDGLIDDQDNSCTGQLIWFQDNDKDGYGDPEVTQLSCNWPPNYAGSGTDCDDSNSTVNPDAVEIADGLDNDCDGLVDEGLSVLNIEAGNCEIVYYGYAPEACQTLTVMVNGGTAPYTYAWSNGAATPSTNVCPTETTTYSIVVTDSNGNTAEDNVTVQVIDIRCGNNNNKVLVCHTPNQHVICISPSAVPDHLSHGDYLGICDAPDPCQGGSQSIAISQSHQEFDVSRTSFSSPVNPDIDRESFFAITPNPVKDQLFLKTNIQTGKISVMDISGKMILHQDVSGSENTINTAFLADGIYYVRLETGRYCDTKNFVVMH